MLMTKERAAGIASDFMRRCNPDCWNGNGKMPDSFLWDGRTLYVLDEANDTLEIWFRKDEKTGMWKHCCVLCMGHMGFSMASCAGEGIHCAGKIAETIMALCETA